MSTANDSQWPSTGSSQSLAVLPNDLMIAMQRELQLGSTIKPVGYVESRLRMVSSPLETGH
jgi:hypothetical protein